MNMYRKERHRAALRRRRARQVAVEAQVGLWLDDRASIALLRTRVPLGALERGTCLPPRGTAEFLIRTGGFKRTWPTGLFPKTKPKCQNIAAKWRQLRKEAPAARLARWGYRRAWRPLHPPLRLPHPERFQRPDLAACARLRPTKPGTGEDRLFAAVLP